MTVVATTLGKSISFGGNEPSLDEDAKSGDEGAVSEKAVAQSVPNVPVADFISGLSSRSSLFRQMPLTHLPQATRGRLYAVVWVDVGERYRVGDLFTTTPFPDIAPRAGAPFLMPQGVLAVQAVNCTPCAGHALLERLFRCFRHPQGMSYHLHGVKALYD